MKKTEHPYKNNIECIKKSLNTSEVIFVSGNKVGCFDSFCDLRYHQSMQADTLKSADICRNHKCLNT